MTQYCRYCTYCCYGDGVWCEKRQTTLSEQYAKSTNKCKYFVLNLIDAFHENERGYIPRKKTEKKYEQIMLNVEGENDNL